MFNLFMLADATAAGGDAVADGLSTGNWILVAAGGVAVAVPLVLKMLGKNVPLIDPVIEAVLPMIRRASAPKAIDPAKKDAEMQKIAQAVRDTTKQDK